MVDQTALISVIIPIYNVERYLYQCIESVLRQSYKNIEIILIDDGSTDESGKICDEFSKKDERIIVIHQKNQGIAEVRNRGVREARGEYIFWIDSDDYVSEDIIEELYNNVVQCEADISICNYTQGSERKYHFELDKCEGQMECFDYKRGLELIYESSHFSFIMAASWAKLIKKSLYEGLNYPSGKIFEDIYMSHKLIRKCQKIVYTDKVMYYYYQWPASILGKKLYIEKLDYLGAFEERIHFFHELNLPELEEKARLQYLHALMWEYSRAKDILHNRMMVKHIKKEYRKYYTFGTENKEVRHETKGYMLGFYISPFCLDFLNKVKGKLKKGLKNG